MANVFKMLEASVECVLCKQTLKINILYIVCASVWVCKWERVSCSNPGMNERKDAMVFSCFSAWKVAVATFVMHYIYMFSKATGTIKACISVTSREEICGKCSLDEEFPGFQQTSHKSVVSVSGMRKWTWFDFGQANFPDASFPGSVLGTSPSAKKPVVEHVGIPSHLLRDRIRSSNVAALYETDATEQCILGNCVQYEIQLLNSGGFGVNVVSFIRSTK